MSTSPDAATTGTSDVILRFLLPGLVALLAMPAHAAESYASCKGYIEALPATITTQGVWCLRANLTTALAAGNAITLAANNVTLDCNHHRVDGRAAGLASEAIGVQVAAGKLNAAVRRCDVRGFRIGMRLEGAGHVVEGNRVSDTSLTGIHAQGDGHIVRGNQVLGLHGRTGTDGAVTGVFAQGEGIRVLDNDINWLGADMSFSGGPAVGIHLERGIADGNRISGLWGKMQESNGIRLVEGVATNNRISIGFIEGGAAIQGDDPTLSVCRGNVIWGLVTAPTGCAASGNVVSVAPRE